MTSFSAIHRQPDPTPPTATDALDATLNALVSPGYDPAVGQPADDRPLDGLIAAAETLHRRVQEAHERHADAGKPAPDLWERILDRHSEEPEMSPSQTVDVARPNSHRDTRWIREWAARRSPGRWLNAVAAALLMIALGAGLWFSPIGPGSGEGAGHLSILPATQGSPVASPASAELLSARDCTVTPLTTDELMAIVANPAGREAAITGTPTAWWPGELTDPGKMTVSAVESTGEVPDEATFAAMQQVVNEYLACWQWGTKAQVWALTAPRLVQTQILEQFPVFRSEEEVQASVDKEKEAPARTLVAPVTPALWLDNVIQANPDRQQSRVYALPDPYMFGFVGTQGFAQDGTPLTTSDWIDNVEVIQDVPGPPPSLGTVTLVKYPGSDRWLVNDVLVQRGDGQ